MLKARLTGESGIVKNKKYQSTDSILAKKFSENELYTYAFVDSGARGSVHVGKLQDKVVAAKRMYLNEKSINEINVHYKLSKLALAHEYIICAMGYIKTKDAYHLIMDYAPGGSLYNDLQRHPLDLNQKINFMRQIIAAVNWLHEQGFLHCDIKSPNIVLVSENQLKLCDFDATIEATQVKSGYAGTPCWIAPELITRTASHSAAADVYSSAIVMWEVQTQLEPYKKYNNYETMQVVVKGERPPISNDCPEAIASLITWGWSATPSDRPTAKQLLTALEEQEAILAAGEPCRCTII